MKCQSLGTGQDCDGDGTSYICRQGDGGPACGCTVVDQKVTKVRRDDGSGETERDGLLSGLIGRENPLVASQSPAYGASQTTAISGVPGPTCTGNPNAAAAGKYSRQYTLASLGVVAGSLMLAGI